jgi:hypothetical protein
MIPNLDATCDFVTLSQFHVAATTVLVAIEKSNKSRTNTACTLNQFLSDLEEKAIVTVCTVLCQLMGLYFASRLWKGKE